MHLDLAISPCPNDTYIFYNFIQPGFFNHTIELALADVEELNRRAIEERRHAISKLSFFAITKLQGSYELLQSGGALGRGCGPLLISGQSESPDDMLRELRRPGGTKRILIPGRWTTANLLTHLFLDSLGLDLEKIEFVPMRYDLILKSLSSGEERYGVIIHEERFTYPRYGLSRVQDLGEWWEKDTGLPIPLGGIAIRKEIPDGVKSDVEKAIRESLRRVRIDDSPAASFIKENAQALEEDVIRSHIDLYVNDFSLDFGEAGRAAIDLLFRRAAEAGIR